MAVWGTGQNYVPKIGKNFTGKIDEVRFLDIATTTFSQYSNNGVTTNTKGLWHFSEGGSATSTADSSSSNKAAALVSTTWTTNHVEVGVGKYDRDFTGTNGYDKAGNRTQMRLINQTGSVSSDVTWQMEYNNLNQLTQRHNGTDGYFTSGTERYTYTYDENGNLHTLHKETKTGTTWSTSEYWVYEYNPRNQLTQATKYSSTSGGYSGKEVYHYCLSCDGAMSEWLTYGTGSQTLPTVWRRYEYDGLNVLRVDEVCDTNLSGYIDTGEETWRTIEVNTHKPGSLGALIGKRVYQYSTRATTTPSSTNDYTYTYDAVGNVQVIYRASGTVGQEAYFFAQDAFGNELSGDTTTPASNRTNLLGGASWSTARTAGITEHQTGKIQSSFTGLVYFGARWYDPVVGRFVSQEIVSRITEPLYIYARNNPIKYYDVNGLYGEADPPFWQIIGEMFFPSDPNEDQGAVDCFLRHRRELCAIAGNSTICHLPDINVSEWVDEAENGIGSCVQDTVCCYVAGAAFDKLILEKTAGELINATLKRNKSFYSDLADYTYRDLLAMDKAGDHRARQMVKLIKKRKKLNCKLKEAGKIMR